MFEELKKVCLPLAVKVGTHLLASRERIKVTAKKPFHDFCTNLDQEAEVMILKTLRRQFPEYGIDSEEAGREKNVGNSKKKKGNKNNTNGEKYHWVVDPVDGTKNYARHLPFYTISLALMKSGKPIFGLVYLPATGELFYAMHQQGAFLQEMNPYTKKIVRTTRLKFHPKKKMDAMHVHLELPVAGTKEYEKNVEMAQNIMKHVSRVRSIGSGSIALCYTARGGYDGYVDLSGTTKIYDLIGGIAICEEAGVKIAHLDNQSLAVGSAQFVSHMRSII